MDVPFQQYWHLLVTYLKPQRVQVLRLAVVLLSSIVLELLSPQIVRAFLDAVQAGAATSVLLDEALLFIGVVLVQQALSVLAIYVGQQVGWTATNRLRADLALHCLRLDMAFHKARTPGELIERIDGDVTALSDFFSQFVILVLGNAVLLLAVLVLLFREDWRVGLAMAWLALLTLVILYRCRKLVVSSAQGQRQASAELFGFLEERLGGLDDLRANGGGAYTLRRLYPLMRQMLLRGRQADMMNFTVVSITFVLFALGYVVALVMGATLYLAGAITLGTVYLFFAYATLLQRPLSELARQARNLQRATAGIGRVRELLLTQSAMVDGTGMPLPSGPLEVEFAQVSFAYEDQGEPTLCDLSFRLQPGKILGVLGRTGSGKTTISRLLFRLYDPGDGTVRLGGRDLRTVPLANLRERIGLVTQEVQLFQATVRDNLTFFDRHIPDTHLLGAIEHLGLRPWFQGLPDGLDTQLGAGGGQLSAGEAQLLAVTRVFLKDPGLIILDEASSRLDPVTERLIEHAIDSLLEQRTGLIIAHRLATVRRADEILVLDAGRVVEYGPRTRLERDPASRFAQLLATGMEEGLA